ncbi:isoprenylcysteine carboxylmethyltransferase family protein [Jannaschia sp. W003]|uniref:methyltransferase family protein n=1 Tax=Jannaschia sp. W003 TaxID=2867012 RepID=UPI0021A6690C|nr:isoprenylcysteine carboxylmethyltransferase family protein [Jannaschia sp. W003]UWQ20340.1 isoprenylcysteine carboxylmethyltransferase family protein [Jannaschia sp. W003]
MSHLHGFPDLPPVWAAGTALAQWAASAVVPLVRVDAAWLDALGGALALAGLALAAWSAWWFRHKRTPIMPRERPTALIVEGPYRVNRNPIYSAMALVLLGLAAMFGTLAALLLAGAFVAVITQRFVRGEEAALRAAFGPEAERYFARTRRW